MTTDVAVVGGGVAGLAAAVQLVLDGAHVLLIEQSGRLGGRTYSYTDEKTGDVVDNGQHILVGAYHATLRYLNLIGTRNLLNIPGNNREKLELPFFHPEHGFVEFSTLPLPRPFDLAAGLLTYKPVPFAERIRGLKLGACLRSWNGSLEHHLSKLTVEEWFTEVHRDNEICRSFWYPLSISVMNELPERASALPFARSLRLSLLGSRNDMQILIPTVGQTTLYVDGALRVLREGHGRVMCNSEVTDITVSGKTLTLKLKSGKSVNARSVIAAVPHFALKRILPAEVKKTKPLIELDRIHSSPIVSIHLWFDRVIMDREFVGFIDGEIQWLFDRRKILGEQKAPAGFLSAVISGAYRHVDLSKAELVERTVRDITTAFPPARNARLIHSVVIKEKRATISPTVEAESLRPSHRTSLSNLFIAGDWTNTGLPATIESAIQSGFACAELTKEELSR